MSPLNRFVFITFIYFMFVVTNAFAQDPFDTWEASSPEIQVDRENAAVPDGKGSIFVPAMTEGTREPMYIVYRISGSGSNLRRIRVDAESPGNSIILDPGYYTVAIGSGNEQQKIYKDVEVKAGNITLFQPDWSGLVVNVIDRTRTQIKETYDLFDQNNENVGIGYGVEEELGEALKPWILKPGFYKIVKTGENVNTTTNFTTVRLIPGELTEYTLVIDEETGNFIGFGILERGHERSSTGGWTIFSEFAGNVILNYYQETGRDEPNSFSGSTRILSDFNYSGLRSYIPIRVIVEEGLTKEANKSLRKYIDKSELRATYIYRFSESFGPYLRFRVVNKLFSTKHLTDEPKTYTKLSAAGDTLDVLENRKEVQLSPSLFPMHLKEGIGANAVILKSFPLTFTLRVGYGARQSYVNDSFILGDNNLTLTRMKTSSLTGLEIVPFIEANLSRWVRFTSDSDFLVSSTGSKSWVYDSENRLRFRLAKFASLDFVFEIWKEEAIKEVQTRQQILLRFSHII